MPHPGPDRLVPPTAVLPAVGGGVLLEPVEDLAVETDGPVASVSDIDRQSPTVVAGAGLGRVLAVLPLRLDLAGVIAVAVVDGEVVPELGLEGCVELDESLCGVTTQRVLACQGSG